MGLMKQENTKLLHPISFKKKLSRKVLATFFVLLVAKSLLVTGILSAIGIDPNFIVKEITSQVAAIGIKTADYKKPGEYAELPAARWIPQTFNNCGPAATAMVLQYFGYNVSQEETRAHLRTNPDDKNVFITEISSYIKNDYGLENKVLFNGDLKTIKTLVANGVYVVVEDFLHPGEDIGHVLVIRGFDDKNGVLVADDSYFGVGIKYPYATWDEGQWKPYNREFMPVYKKDREEIVKSIIGENWDERTMYKASIEVNLADTVKNPNDMYAWFNLGKSYYHLGEYQKAKDAFEKSQNIGWPKRMLWYFTEPVENYNKLGEYQKAIDTANLGLWYNDNFSEMHDQKSVAYKGLGQIESLKTEAQKAVNLDPGMTSARDLLR